MKRGKMRNMKNVGGIRLRPDGTPVRDNRYTRHMLSRRGFLGTAAAGVGAAAVGLGKTSKAFGYQNPTTGFYEIEPVGDPEYNATLLHPIFYYPTTQDSINLQLALLGWAPGQTSNKLLLKSTKDGVPTNFELGVNHDFNFFYGPLEGCGWLLVPGGDVHIQGEKDAKGNPLTKLVGGFGVFHTWDLFNYPMQPTNLVADGLHFDQYMNSALTVVHFSGCKVTNNRFTNAIPHANYTGDYSYGLVGAIFMGTAYPWLPGTAPCSGDVVITDNYVSVEPAEDWVQPETYMGVPYLDDVTNTVFVNGAFPVDTAVPPFNGKVTISRNQLYGSNNGAIWSGGHGVDGNGQPYRQLISDNIIECTDCNLDIGWVWGFGISIDQPSDVIGNKIKCIHPGAEGIEQTFGHADGSTITKNKVVMDCPWVGWFSGGLSFNCDDLNVSQNNVSGTVMFGLWFKRGAVNCNLQANNVARLNSHFGIDVYFEPGAHDNTLVGLGGSVFGPFSPEYDSDAYDPYSGELLYEGCGSAGYVDGQPAYFVNRNYLRLDVWNPDPQPGDPNEECWWWYYKAGYYQGGDPGTCVPGRVWVKDCSVLPIINTITGYTKKALGKEVAEAAREASEARLETLKILKQQRQQARRSLLLDKLDK